MQLIPQALQRPWIRTVAVISIASLVLVGSASAAVTLNANIDTTGNLDVDGNTVLGNGGADTATFNGETFTVTASNLMDVNAAIDADASGSFSFTTTGDQINFLTNHTGGLSNVILSAGSAAPNAGEDGGGDVVIEAQDDFLVETTDDLNIDIGGDVFIDSGEGGTGITLTADGGSDTIALNGNVTVGTSVTPIDTIVVGAVSDGDSGWAPDGVATSFTVTANAASVSASNITVSLSSNATATVCGVSGMVVSTSFTVNCTVAPADGAVLHYSIVTLAE